MEVKVGDFGLSKVLKAGKDYYRTSERGALPVRWMSPECLFDFIFTTKSDVVIENVKFIRIEYSCLVVVWNYHLGSDDAWNDAVSRYM